MLAVLAGLVALFFVLADFITDLWWYRAVQYSEVFTTRLTTRLVLFVVFGITMALVVAVNVVIAYRLRPNLRGMSQEQQNLDRYRVGLDPYKVPMMVLAATLLAILSGASASGEWRTWLLWRNGTRFGATDPQFHKDVSFYMFSYPWWRFLLGFGFAVVVVSLLATALTHYLYGGLRLQTPGRRRPLPPRPTCPSCWVYSFC